MAPAKRKDAPAKKWFEKARRRKRTTYTAEQLEVLVREFEENHSPSTQKLNTIADELGFETVVSFFSGVFGLFG
jgi:hypothetical protein